MLNLPHLDAHQDIIKHFLAAFLPQANDHLPLSPLSGAGTPLGPTPSKGPAGSTPFPRFGAPPPLDRLSPASQAASPLPSPARPRQLPPPQSVFAPLVPTGTGVCGIPLPASRCALPPIDLVLCRSVCVFPRVLFSSSVDGVHAFNCACGFSHSLPPPLIEPLPSTPALFSSTEQAASSAATPASTTPAFTFALPAHPTGGAAAWGTAGEAITPTTVARAPPATAWRGAVAAGEDAVPFAPAAGSASATAPFLRDAEQQQQVFSFGTGSGDGVVRAVTEALRSVVPSSSVEVPHFTFGGRPTAAAAGAAFVAAPSWLQPSAAAGKGIAEQVMEL